MVASTVTLMGAAAAADAEMIITNTEKINARRTRLAMDTPLQDFNASNEYIRR